MPMAEFSGGAAWTVTVVCNVVPPLHLMVIAYLVGEVGKTPTSLDFEPVTIATTDAGSAGVLVTVGVPDVHAVRPTAVATPAGTLWVASVTQCLGGSREAREAQRHGCRGPHDKRADVPRPPGT